MSVLTTPGPGWDDLPGRMEAHGHYLDDHLGELKRRAYLDLVTRWGGGCETGRVLKTDLFEEACGPDHLLSDLGQVAERAAGLDVSLAVVLAARRRHPRVGTWLIVADVRQLPYREASFDLILSASTLDHFPQPDDLGVSLRELLRATRVGGRMVVSLDNRGNVFDPLLRLAKLVGVLPFYLGRSYHVAELVSELKQLGVRVLDTTAIIHHPRMMAVGSLWLARRLGSKSLRRLIRRSLDRMQVLEASRWRYLTGCFVAAVAERPQSCQQPPG